MKLILMLISMVIVCYLTAQYLTQESITGLPGVDGGMRPSDLVEHTKDAVRQIDEDAAKRAAESMPPP